MIRALRTSSVVATLLVHPRRGRTERRVVLLRDGGCAVRVRGGCGRGGRGGGGVSGGKISGGKDGGSGRGAGACSGRAGTGAGASLSFCFSGASGWPGEGRRMVSFGRASEGGCVRPGIKRVQGGPAGGSATAFGTWAGSDAGSAGVTVSDVPLWSSQERRRGALVTAG